METELFNLQKHQEEKAKASLRLFHSQCDLVNRKVESLREELKTLIPNVEFTQEAVTKYYSGKAELTLKIKFGEE